MTPEQIRELRELETRATPGPWEIERENVGDEASCYAPAGIVGSNGFPVISPEGGLAPAGCEWRVSTLEANAQLIAAMRNAIVELLDAVEMVNVWHFSYDKLWGQFLQLDKLYMGAWQEGANTCLANDALSRQLQVLADENAELRVEIIDMPARFQQVVMDRAYGERLAKQLQADLAAKDIEIAQLRDALVQIDYALDHNDVLSVAKSCVRNLLQATNLEGSDTDGR